MSDAFLASARLRDAGFPHGFSTRASGVDVGLLAGAIGLDAAATYQVNQVHGARVVRGVGDPGDLRHEEADAVIAWAAAVDRDATLPAVGIRVADCVPVLVGDRTTGAVAAIHAGWRGLVAGVIGASLRAMDEAGSASREVGSRVAAIGPCIGPCCFEVGRDIAREIARAVASDAVIARHAGEKAFVDLRLAARLRLRADGLDDGAIDDVAGCTRCDAARFFSYRRDGAAAGRHLALIRSFRPSQAQSSSSSSSST